MSLLAPIPPTTVPLFEPGSEAGGGRLSIQWRKWLAQLPGYMSGTLKPIVDFSTHGDLTVVYATQVCRWMYLGDYMRAELDLVFTPTFTTAANELLIQALPTLFNKMVKIGAIDGPQGACETSGDLTWPTGYTSITLAPFDDLNIGLRANGSTKNGAWIEASNMVSGQPYTIKGELWFLHV